MARMPVDGKGYREIAQELCLSDNIVKFYMKAIFRNLGGRSRRNLKDTLQNPRT